ncbi:VIT1/CCC1 transporter family protein [Thermococcus gorgonarius]|uniref:Rubrerythrin family protein n=1 Tax=Thermococcus gorgonarius TaxID=71997 RepID=A0A2Z2M5Q8_THEGO|nr:VIT1/CCC1 transporter family protein [Thermococcus gorgonarius]ASJ00493.1 rubrerythrin family protein [Thermococcus gorgonarius]
MEEMLKLAKKFYKDEYSDSVLYAKLSRTEKDKNIREEFLRLSQIESKHARFWYEFLKARGIEVKKPEINRMHELSIRILRKLLGPGAVASLLELGERSAVQKYFRYLTEYSDKLSSEEIEKLKEVILDELEHEQFFRESKKSFHTENIRDLVLGMNDGLVEILGAVTGLSAVYTTTPKLVGISGVIVGVAGSLSMGIGAFISVRSQRQVNEALRERMKVLFKISPEKAKEEIKERLIEGGVPEEVAENTAEELAKRGEGIVELLAPEGNENEVRSALYTGIAYLLGVIFPVLPYFLAPTSTVALPFSILLAGTVLAIVATLVSILSGISIKSKIIEMVTTGLGAAFLSYLFGRLMEGVFHVSTL